MFKKSDFKKIKNQSSIVFNSALLAELNPLERYELLQLCHRRKYKEGEFIYYQNDPGTGMYFIEDGTVRLAVSNDSDNEEQQYQFNLTAPSEFGTMSIGYDIRRLSSAQCITECTLLGFFKPDFETLKKRHPETAVKFLEAVAIQAMRQLEQTMRKLSEILDIKEAFSILYNSSHDKDTK